MKRILLCTVLFSTLLGCARQGDGAGWISVRLLPRTAVAEATKSDVADYAALPAAEDFILELRNHADVLAWTGRLSDWDDGTALTAGPYTMTARYGNVEEEGFGKPAFVGEERFQVIAFETVPVLVKPKLANAIVQVKTGPMFRKYFTGATFRVTTASGAEFDIKEGAGLFVEAYRFTLTGTMTAADDRTVSFDRTFSGLEPATCYTVLLEAENVGGWKLNIAFDDTLEVISIEEDLN
ncbi:MAG: DUF4493 domain-containing protein [Bacteroidales bacterium]|nr:DUF4493 domain-containing protein [Bacteroidales bacterium]